MIAGLLDHLWQSTLFAGGAGLLTLMLRHNPARLRFRLWFAASLKFLVPFAALSAAGESLSRLFPAALPRLVLEIQPAAERLSAPARALAMQQHAETNLVSFLAATWLLGLGVVLGLRLMRWLRLYAVVRQAHDAGLAAPVDVKASPSLLEPGLVGILKPVVLLPERLMPRLSKAERDAIMAHELCHLSSGDNMTAAIHMLVEALFWFYPPVWLIGGRLIAERERACDESVLADGHDAEVYAQGILKVCRFCVQSPLACASGASGSDLSRRVRQIMSGETVSAVHGAQKALLAAALAVALGLPVAEGFVTTPPLIAAVQKRVEAVKSQVAAQLVQVAGEAQQIAALPARPAKMRTHKVKNAEVSQTPEEISPQAQRLAEAETQAGPLEPAADPSVATPAPQPEPAAEASTPLQQRTAIEQALVALYPQGTGDPAGVTCRSPEMLPGSRLPGPKVCQTNRQWASLRARHEDITPDGQGIIMPDGSEVHDRYALVSCMRERFLLGGINNSVGVLANVCF
jgi:beta-lactamase regulating signal transducer with metallopeptidase domain